MTASFDPAPPLSVAPQWQWPVRIPAADAQRIIDQRAIVFLEESPRSFWQSRQDVLLQRLLAFVHDVSPAWRAHLGAGVSKAAAADLSALPVLERAQFRALAEQGGAMPVPANHGAVVKHSTSGSTGMPVAFFLTEFALRIVRHHYGADSLRHGRNLMERRAALGSRTEPHPGREHVFAQGNPWLGESHLYTRRNVDFSMDEHARWLAKLAPAYLALNPTVLSGILESFESGIAPPAGLKQLMTFGATVEPQLRRRARALLGASIRDRYSCEEVGPVALQCPHDGSDEPPYHVCVGNVIVEVVDEHGKASPPGETGRVLVTGLHHWASPAIRYDIGDVAALSPQCTCGAHVPTLIRLLGRKRALLRTPSGQSKFVRLTASDWLDIAPVREFRLIQESPLKIRVELVVGEPLTAQQRAALTAMLHRRVSSEFAYDLQQLDAIDWPPGEKRQDVVCLL